MNIQKNINKLLYALSTKDKFYKINSFKFYSQKSKKYCTKYQILKKELLPILENEEIEYIEKYNVDFEYYSKLDVMKYLIDEYKKGSEACEK